LDWHCGGAFRAHGERCVEWVALEGAKMAETVEGIDRIPLEVRLSDRSLD
jgi:hypothetical protein